MGNVDLFPPTLAHMSPPEVLLWINGHATHSTTRETFEVRNPQSTEVVTIAASASSEDCKDAVNAASNAFVAWQKVTPTEKRAIFLKAADLIESEKFFLKAIQTVQEETYAASMWANADARMAARSLRDAAGLAVQVLGQTYPSSAVPGAEVLVQRKPHGVILAIAPWNAPIVLTVRAVAIPLICGNTVVLKSSENSPRSQAIVVEALHEAGLPAGVLNYISISRQDSPKLTAELIGNPIIRHINFTGSDRVGKIIATEAAKYLKPCVLELGGKAPAVVLDDANISNAARAITYGAMLHSGQICMSTERVIVQRNAAPALQSALVELCRKLKAGDHIADPSVQLSCLFSEGSAANVVAMVKEAKDAGAEVLLGDLERVGAVVQPHVLSGVKPGMRAWDRESFGPVIVITVVDTIDDAVEMANASDYSLIASVFTEDRYKGVDVAGRLRAGFTSVNGPTIHSEPALGNAGLGGATGYGRFDIEHFTVKRGVVVHPPNRTYPLVG
ncbi:aldehyde dehydrogenase [Rickenella mellea]|uniref:Aldehyde dehydrogenase n=1 Tax=Rickenella mellea TaxID=50990 RepID=A0A4Y7QCC3_9AGAM|nr:aldehyde dehydrogenase [Rickenella mellea]